MNDPCCSLRVLGTWTLAAALIGCGGAQAGGQTGEETEGGCRLAVTPLALDEVSPLGFSASDVLEFSEGERQAELRWLASDLDYGPEHGDSGITARVTLRGKAQFVKVVEDKNLRCVDAVRVPITLELTTSGGALSERMDTRLVANSSTEAKVSALREPSELQGEFAFDPASLGQLRFIRLELDVHWGSGVFSGLIHGGVESVTNGDGDGVASLRPVPLACWGPAQGANRAVCDM